jgi:F-type H+-transporting ATPase subunit epsilon
LGVGEVRYQQEGKVERAAVAGGFLEVKKDSVVILADEAAMGARITRSQGTGALAAAETALREARTQEDVEAALAAQKKAAAWISAAKE